MLHFVDTARVQNASDRVTYNLWRAMFWGGDVCCATLCSAVWVVGMGVGV